MIEYTLMGIQDRPDDLPVEKEGGGSVAIYMKNEATFIELQLPKCKACVIGSVYRM